MRSVRETGKRWAGFVGAAALAGLGLTGSVEADGFYANYAITLAGLPLGTADVKSSFDGTRYTLDLNTKLSGLVGAVTGGGGGRGSAAGSVAGSRPVPSTFSMTTGNSSEQRTIQMTMAGGNVAGLEITPPFDEKPDRVPLSEAHKRAVVDPVSALVMPAVGRGPLLDPENCNRTIPVFDGGVRFDVVLSYAATRKVEKPGYTGPVLVCDVRYVPIAGHRAHRPGTKFMADNRDMSVWLAPVESARLLIPLRIAVKTMVGMSIIEATRWTFEGAQPGTPSGQALRNPKT